MSKAENQWNQTTIDHAKQTDESEWNHSCDDDSSEKVKENLFELTAEEKENLCRTFTLLNVDGDGIVKIPELRKLLVSLGRLPLDDNLNEILSHADPQDPENSNGINYSAFENYLTEQLKDLTNEEQLRRAFEVFDENFSTGKVNVKELRQTLKTVGDAMTDDEIDFLYREEDYWMLDENYCVEYDKLIDKIMDRECDCKFLNC